MRALLLGLALLASSAASAAQPPLAVRLSVEIEEQHADGVLRISRYHQRYYRNAGQVWEQRELPGWAAKLEQQRSEHELDTGAAPRWVQALADGAASLSLIDPANKRVYVIAPSEHERTSFGGRWASQASLIDPAALKSMKKMSRAGRGGAVWYSREDAGSYERVLWDAQREFPLELESGSKDGRRNARTVVEFRALPAQWPWQQITSYTRRELSDLAD